MILFEKLDFHHIGIATKNLDRELTQYSLLGYKLEGEKFVDPLQGIAGCFIISHTGPRLELLTNIEGSTTLTNMNAKGIRMYHLGYLVKDGFNLEEFLSQIKGIVIREPLYSVAFKKNICFISLRNQQIIELIGV